MEQNGFVDVSFMLQCGVYALLKGKRIVYIGQSRKPLDRIRKHLLARGKLRVNPGSRNGFMTTFQFDGIWVWPCALGEMDELERRLIKEYNPRHNYQHTPQVKMSLEELMGLMPTPIAMPQLHQRPGSWRRL